MKGNRRNQNERKEGVGGGEGKGRIEMGQTEWDIRN